MAALGVAACGAGAGGALPGESSLTTTLATDRAAYASGQPVGLILTVTNAGGAPVTLRFTSGQRYDFTIGPAGGDPVWRWSAGRAFIQMLGEERVSPGSRLEFRERYGGVLEPGRYRATGVVTAMDRQLEVAAEFTVVPSEADPPPSR